MASPAILGGIGIAGSAAGGILGAFGAKSSGDATAAMYQYKAGMAAINKQISDQNQQWALQSGGVQAELSGLKSAQEIGGTKVAQSAGGLDVNSGSPAATRGEQIKAAQFDQETIAWNAQKTAYGFAVKGAEATAEGTMDTMAASNAKTAGDINALSSILGGVSSVSSKWLQASNIGLTGSKGPVGAFDPNNYGAAPTWSTT
jgi:hypothetical protein